MTSHDVKEYLSTREIPQLFESLMTGLLFNRPDDHINFLQHCLERVKLEGLHNIHWNCFIETLENKRKTPLPPITPGMNGQHLKEPTKDVDSLLADLENTLTSYTVEPAEPMEMNKHSPLPPIGRSDTMEVATTKEVPKVPIVLVLGGPGSGKLAQCQQILERYPTWCHLSMGDLLRTQVSQQGTAADKWGMIGDLITKGEMAPEDITMELLLSNLHKHPNADGYLIEGYPRTMEQVDEYNKHIGKVDLAILLDCEESTCQARLEIRAKEAERIDDNDTAIKRKLEFFKNNTLPVCKYYDDQGKLVIIDGDRDRSEIFFEINMCFERAFYSEQMNQVRVPSPPKSPRKSSSKRARSRTSSATKPVTPPQPQQESERRTEVVEEVIEAQITKSTDDVTGDKGNTAYTLELDKLDIKESAGDILRTKKIIFVIGGPGSGKGTQCQNIVDTYGYTHISTGDLLRNEVQSGTPRGQKLTDIMAKGQLVPMDIVLDLLREAMVNVSPRSKGFILDGYPRELEQALRFEEEVCPCDFVLYLDVPDEVMKTRLLERGKTSGRVDDNEETITKRLKTFNSLTMPVIEHYDKQKKAKKINCEGTIEEVFGSIQKVLDQLHTYGIERLEVDVNPLKESTTYFVLGGPGSGKGTQCERIVQKYGLTHLSTGDLLRDAVKSESEIGKKLNEIMQTGGLVPLDFVLDLLKDAMLKKLPESKGFLIDGYPREIEQGIRFEKEVGPVKRIIYFEVSEDEMKKRLINRGKTSGRVDDNEATIQKRLKTFRECTHPVVTHYGDQNKVLKVNAEAGIDEVWENTQKCLDDLHKEASE